MANTTFHSLTLPGLEPALAPSIAEEFTEGTNYQVKDYCTYQGKLYRCIVAHTAGAWNVEHFIETDIDTEFDRKLDVPVSQASAPINPRVGDLWIDSDENSPIYNIDASPILGSTNVVQSGGIKTALNSLDSRKMEHGAITGDFSASVDYRVGDLVFYATTTNGITSRILYRCITDHDAAAWNAAHFTPTTLEVELQKIRDSEADTDMIGDLFGSKSTYAVGDYCVFNTNLYKCIRAIDNSNTNAPAFNEDDWEQVKLSNEINGVKKYIDNQIAGIENNGVTGGYIRPEQYGAVGDGVTDDSAALQSCINEGGRILLSKEYFIGSTKLVANTQIELVCTPNSKIIANSFEYNYNSADRRPGAVLELKAEGSRVYGMRVFAKEANQLPYIEVNGAQGVEEDIAKIIGRGSNVFAIFVEAPRCVIRDLYGFQCCLIRLGNVNHEGCVIDGLYGDYVEIGIYAANATNVIVNNVRFNASREIYSDYYHPFYFCNTVNCTFSNVVIGASGTGIKNGSNYTEQNPYINSDIFHFNFNGLAPAGGDVVVTNATAIDGCFKRFCQVNNYTHAYFSNCTGKFTNNVCLIGQAVDTAQNPAKEGDPSATFTGCTFEITKGDSTIFGFRCTANTGRIWLHDCRIIDKSINGYLVSGGLVADGCTFEVEKWKINIYTPSLTATYVPPAFAKFHNCTIKAKTLDAAGISPEIPTKWIEYNENEQNTIKKIFTTEYYNCNFAFGTETPANPLISTNRVESKIFVVGGSVENCNNVYSGTENNVTVINLPYKNNSSWSIYSTLS